jgi:hypothetical protein
VVKSANGVLKISPEKKLNKNWGSLNRALCALICLGCPSSKNECVKCTQTISVIKLP